MKFFNKKYAAIMESFNFLSDTVSTPNGQYKKRKPSGMDTKKTRVIKSDISNVNLEFKQIPSKWMYSSSWHHPEKELSIRFMHPEYDIKN